MKTTERQWKTFYKIGGISVFAAFLVMLAEIFITFLPDGAREYHGVADVFEMYNRNWFMAMRFMGLMNIFATTLGIPVFFALYGLYREKLQVYAGFALITAIIGYVIIMSDNVSFAFLELAKKYSVAASYTDKSQIIAAGEALFAKGASHTPGTFSGFLIAQIASILFSLIIIKGGVLKKSIGIIGLISFSFLIVFEIVSSFIPSMYEQAMIFAGIGGVLALVWYIMLGLGLLKESKK